MNELIKQKMTSFSIFFIKFDLVLFLNVLDAIKSVPGIKYLHISIAPQYKYSLIGFWLRILVLTRTSTFSEVEISTIIRVLYLPYFLLVLVAMNL